MKNMGWAILKMRQQNFIKKIVITLQTTKTRTDTANCGHGKFAFHDSINKRELATNSCFPVKDNVDHGCSRLVFHGAINMHEQLMGRGNRYHGQKHVDLLQTLLSHVPVPQITRLTQFPSSAAWCPAGIGPEEQDGWSLRWWRPYGILR